MVRNLLAMLETEVQTLGQEDPLDLLPKKSSAVIKSKLPSCNDDLQSKTHVLACKLNSGSPLSSQTGDLLASSKKS